MKQSDSVFQAVCSVVDASSFDTQVVLTSEQRAQVIAIVTQGIIEGQVDFTAEAYDKHNTDAKIKSYTGGMVSNHLRKDKRLNGGVKYEAQNPGSRVKDETLKALKALAKATTDVEALAKINLAIEDRVQELNLSKKKSVTINVEALPEALRHLVS
jgi:hypothetical protein